MVWHVCVEAGYVVPRAVHFCFGCTALACLAAFGVSCERFFTLCRSLSSGYFVSCRAYQAAGSARGSAQEDGHFGLSADRAFNVKNVA